MLKYPEIVSQKKKICTIFSTIWRGVLYPLEHGTPVSKVKTHKRKIKQFAQYLAEFGDEFFILCNIKQHCQNSELIKEERYLSSN